MKDFNFKTLVEEESLSIEEKREYYKEYREYVLSRKLQTSTPGIVSMAPKCVNVTKKIAGALVNMLIAKDAEKKVEGLENIPEGACIFAYTHEGMLDNFIWIPYIDKHCPILHGAGVNKLLLLAQLNTGLILVKKGDKVNNFNAKLDMINLLMNGHSITYFPEGTWNLSPNKLHLPLSFGFLDVARKANVPVVPAVHDINYEWVNGKYLATSITTVFGKPIYITMEDDIREKLTEYEEAISTIKIDLMARRGIIHRKDISNNDYIDFLKKSYGDLQMGKLNWEEEIENIYSGQDDFYKFHHINDIPFNDDGELLDTPENIKLNLINKRHL